MTVQELIDRLQKLDDKSKKVYMKYENYCAEDGGRTVHDDIMDVNESEIWYGARLVEGIVLSDSRFI